MKFYNLNYTLNYRLNPYDLSKNIELISGIIKFIFQPAEEGFGGAKFMIDDGALEGVEEIYGLHVWNYQESGTIGLKSGPVM